MPRQARAQPRGAGQGKRVTLEEANRSGRRVAEARSISFSYGNHELMVKDFSTIIQRGDRIGIVGSNGVGKIPSSNCCWSRLRPDQSRCCSALLGIAYSDQLRSEFDPEKDLMTMSAGGQQFIG